MYEILNFSTREAKGKGSELHHFSLEKKGPPGVSAKVWECAVLEPVGDALAVDGLLTHTRYHLGYVDERACIR
jgi:hypothetical protein